MNCTGGPTVSTFLKEQKFVIYDKVVMVKII